MSRTEKTVFISYRRKDLYHALAVYQNLTANGYDVFFDYQSIHAGDFERIILSNIKARAHFLVILTPSALDRCSEPGDWLRREIETALEEKRNIIPLFFEGFNFGDSSVTKNLSGRLETIKRYNGLEIPSGYFNEAMDRLRNLYLSIPLNAVLHPVSSEVQRVVQEQQTAANIAISHGKKTDKGFTKKKSVWNPILVTLGIIGFIFIAFVGLIFGGNYIIKNLPQKEMPAPASPTRPIPTNTFTLKPPTATPAPQYPIGSTMISPKDGMTIMYIPPGEFEMGSEVGYEFELPVHTVYLDSFWIDQTEVTNAMYSKCVQARVCSPPSSTGSHTRDSYYGDSEFDDFPVVFVSWDDAKTYCDWAERRLPTEAEWEKAARGGLEEKKYPWGDEAPVCEKGVVNGAKFETDNCEEIDTDNVRSYAPNGYGIYDMAGNVWEWVADWYGESYYQYSPQSNPTGPSYGQVRMLRGGSWVCGENDIRTSVRDSYEPSFETFDFGFRCALSASE